MCRRSRTRHAHPMCNRGFRVRSDYNNAEIKGPHDRATFSWELKNRGLPPGNKMPTTEPYSEDPRIHAWTTNTARAPPRSKEVSLGFKKTSPKAPNGKACEKQLRRSSEARY